MVLGVLGAAGLYVAFPPQRVQTENDPEPTATAANSSSALEDASAPDAEAPSPPEPSTLAEQREQLYKLLADGGASPEEVAAVRAIVEASPFIGQGNPDVTVHPMTRAECRKRRSEAKVVADDPAICGKKYMVPLYNPEAGQTRDAAKVCIDQFEFPGLPCEYPVVNVRANEAEAICRAVGKRLCDAHEWEGGCAGALHSPDEEYLFNHDRRYSSGMHNIKRQIVWAYGPKKNHPICGTTSFKTKDCPGGGWKQCGSNTFPTGSFPECKSPFGVYDQHGNAAEHMNLPTRPEEMMSRGTDGGLTEMKGSWFIFAKGEPHLDDCRWREPSWHESKVKDPNSHRNYHLGFRCCRDL